MDVVNVRPPLHLQLSRHRHKVPLGLSAAGSDCSEGSQRPQAPAQLGWMAELVNRLNDARKSLAIIVPTDNRCADAARPLNVDLGFFVGMNCVEENQGGGRAVIGPIEIALVHPHLLDVSRLDETKQHLGRQCVMQRGGQSPWIPTVIVDRDDPLSRRFPQSDTSCRQAEQRPDLYDRAIMMARLLDELTQQASFGFVEC